MVELNTLISENLGIYVFIATNIDDRGEIAGSAALPNGDKRAVLLIPCREGTEDCASEASLGAVATHDSILTEAQRFAIRRNIARSGARLAQRFHISRRSAKD